MSETMDLFSGTLNDLANGPMVQGPGGDGITKALMIRLNEKGLTLAALADPRMMARSLGTLQKHAREYGLRFPDYVPFDLRPVVTFRLHGDFWQLSGDEAPAVAKLLGLVVTKPRGSEVPTCSVPIHTWDDARAPLAAAFYRVKAVRPKVKKPKREKAHA